MPPEAPRPKITLKPTDTSRLKTKTASAMPKVPPTPPPSETPAVPALPPPSPAEDAPAHQTTMLTDPLTLRDTDASRLKRVKLDAQSPATAVAISPSVGLGREKRDTSETVHLKVIREKKKEVPGVGLVSQTVRLRPPTKSQEPGVAMPGSEMLAPTPQAPPVPAVPLAPPPPAAAAPAVPPAPTAAPIKPVIKMGGMGAPKLAPKTIPPAAAAPTVPAMPESSEEAADDESGDSKIRTTTIKLRPSAGLKPLPTPGPASAAASTMAVPAPTAPAAPPQVPTAAAPAVPTAAAPPAKPVSGHTIKIKSLAPPTTPSPVVPLTVPPAKAAPAIPAPTMPAKPGAATVTAPKEPGATVTIPTSPAVPPGETVRMTAEEVPGGQSRKTLKLKGPSLSGGPSIALEGAGAVAVKAAAAGKGAAAEGGTDMFSFALAALTFMALATLTGFLAWQVKIFTL